MGNTPKGWLCKKHLKMNVFRIAHPKQSYFVPLFGSLGA
jgi:hypothetical protein